MTLDSSLHRFPPGPAPCRTLPLIMAPCHSQSLTDTWSRIWGKSFLVLSRLSCLSRSLLDSTPIHTPRSRESQGISQAGSCHGDICVSEVELAEGVCSSPQLTPVTVLTSGIQFSVALDEKVGKRESMGVICQPFKVQGHFHPVCRPLLPVLYWFPSLLVNWLWNLPQQSGFLSYLTVITLLLRVKDGVHDNSLETCLLGTTVGSPKGFQTSCQWVLWDRCQAKMALFAFCLKQKNWI